MGGDNEERFTLSICRFHNAPLFQAHNGCDHGFGDALRVRSVEVCPASELHDAKQRIEDLERVLGFARGAIEYAREPHHLDHTKECGLCHVAAESLDDALAQARSILAQKDDDG